jgi:hypothetical protein
MFADSVTAPWFVGLRARFEEVASLLPDQPSVGSMLGFATRFDWVRAAAGEPLGAGAAPAVDVPVAFGRRVRFVGVGSGVDAALATLALPVALDSPTAGRSTVWPDATAASGPGAGRDLAQAGAASTGSNSSWRKIAAGRRTGSGPDGPSSSATAAVSAGPSAGDGSRPGRRCARLSSRLNAMARA